MSVAVESFSFDGWMAHLSATPAWAPLFAADPGERERRGYINTIHEICQQPLLWERTAADLITRLADLEVFLRRDSGGPLLPLILTGSGSSLYVAECVALVLQARLGIPARAVPAAQFLTHADAVMTAEPAVVISFARSGDSPESSALVDLLLDRCPACRHLAITCNALGRLATGYSTDSRVRTVVLDRRTNDRSLVMTGSFTNMVIAGLALAAIGDADAQHRFTRTVRIAAAGASAILSQHADRLSQIARSPFQSACFLGTGPGLGAARESALKMLEMSGGEVGTIAETPLGLRHGPMAAIRHDTLVVASLPSSSLTRGYVLDVLQEIAVKRPDAPKVIIGEGIPPAVLGESGAAVTLSEHSKLDDGLTAVLDVVVGQTLAFFRCLAGGLRPDGPSPDGMISRVVPEFPIYR